MGDSSDEFSVPRFPSPGCAACSREATAGPSAAHATPPLSSSRLLDLNRGDVIAASLANSDSGRVSLLRNDAARKVTGQPAICRRGYIEYDRWFETRHHPATGSPITGHWSPGLVDLDPRPLDHPTPLHQLFLD